MLDQRPAGKNTKADGQKRRLQVLEQREKGDEEESVET